MTHVSLFSGIGGIDLAAEWAGFTTIVQVEADPWRRQVLSARFPGVRQHDDVRTFPDRDYGPVVLVSGGFPCQPFSCAGKRRGQDDRRNLWPEMARVIRQLKPAWVLAENTAGAIQLVLDRALADLEEAGYACAAVVLPALAVGAWHERQRLFILAHASSQRRPPEGDGRKPNLAHIASKKQHIRQSQDQRVARPATDTAESGSALLQQRPAEAPGAWRDEPRAAEWWETEHGVVRVVHGLPRWLDRHRRRRVAALGDSCVPEQVYPILQAITMSEGGPAEASGRRE